MAYIENTYEIVERNQKISRIFSLIFKSFLRYQEFLKINFSSRTDNILSYKSPKSSFISGLFVCVFLHFFLVNLFI